MASRKEMMGMDAETLRILGLEAGLTFQPGLSKSKMVLQLEAHQASGWMETNSQLLHATEEGGFDHMQGFAGYEDATLSDAARIAQQLSGAGYTETFHHVMSQGKSHHVEAVHGYMAKLGVSADDVWMHMPQANPNEPIQPFNYLKGYLNNHWNDYQDAMPPLEGHYAGDIMGEYATNKGTVQDSYNHLAHMYLNKAAYNNPHAYEQDVTKVASRLASAMGNQFVEVAYAAATGGKVGYHSILPQLGSDVVSGATHPRAPLNAAGLPLGSVGSAVGNRSNYSLISSLTGRPEDSGPMASALREDIGDTMRSLAGSYKGGGETGMNPHRHQTSDYDMIMDSSTRYVGIEDARSGYNNLDDQSYSAGTIRSVIENNYDQLEADAPRSFDPAASSRAAQAAFAASQQTGNGFQANFGAPSDYNAGRSRREGIAISNMDAAFANFRDVADGDRRNPVQFHNFEQGSQEWLDFRKQFDITGSTVGGLLGSNSYTRPWAEMIDRIGLSRGDGSVNSFTQRMFDIGHKREDEARIRVSERLGQEIQTVGSITNDNFPGMMYSPDGLIGDNALWEHKAPERAGKFADLMAGDHPDYMDQIQLGMTLSGRSRTLFSQTIGQETRDQWIDHDPNWLERNQNRLSSISGRLAAGREFVANNQGLSNDDMIKGARAAMTGAGIWRDVSQRSDRGFSAAAGTDEDPYIGRGNPYSNIGQTDNGYIPNFVTGAGNQLMNVPQPSGDGAETGMALAVKQGILAARDETKRQEAGASAASAGFDDVDADFDDLGRPGGRNYGARIRDAFGGGQGNGGNGGGGGRNPPRNWADDAGDSLYAGLRGGSLRSLQSGTLDAIESLPVVGGIIRGSIGAAGAAGDAIEQMNNYRGMAEDAGMTSGVGYSAMSQGLEMMGLNANQAEAANQSVHSAYNRMANGDPSAAVQMSVATRGLLTLADVRASGGDPTRLAEIFRSKAQQRGWSQERIAGAAEMAGLDGFARTATRSDYTMNRARINVDDRMREDTHAQDVDWEFGNTDRAESSPRYFGPRYGYEHGSSVGMAAGDAMAGGFHRLDASVNELTNLTQTLESGGRDYNTDGTPVTSSTGAKYSMQVLPSTARDPGYGIKPARNDSPEEYNRVGRELLGKMVDRYNGDNDKAAAAYTDGAGTVDSAVKLYGDDWLKHMPAQAQKRVSDLHRLSQGAGGFQENGSNGPSVGVINVNVQATVNGKTAAATATVGGQSRSHEINVKNGTVDSRR